MAQWNKLLTSLGFSESESNVYLASLELGPSPVQIIAKKAGVSRVTAYAVIEKLTEQGLMSSVTKGKRQLYSAESPERLASYTSSRVLQMQASLKDLQGMLEELKLLQRGQKPAVRLFEGPEAFQRIQDDVLSSKQKEIFEIGNNDVIIERLKYENVHAFGKKLDKQGIKVKAIYVVTPPHQFRASASIRTLSSRDYDFKGDLFIYGDKIALSTFGEKMISILIESPELARTFRQIFQIVWTKAT
jgi:sugar-specific transcriptional regulator TrmB